MTAPEIGNFDDIQEVEFVKFDDGKIRVRFTTSEFLVDQNVYNNKTYTFSVVEGTDDKLMGVTSKRLMLKLKNLHPLEGKVLDITRIGVGMDTDYEVDEVTE